MSKRSCQPASHGDPFAVLGVHEAGTGHVCPLLRPRHAETVVAYTSRRRMRPVELTTAETMPASSRGSCRSRLSGSPASALPRRAMPAATGRLTDPYSFWPGARADGRLLSSPKDRTFGCSTRWAPMSIEHEGADRRALSPSGLPMPAASPWSAISTTGTAVATSCGCAATPASGKSSRLMFGAGATYKFEIVGPRWRRCCR